jgi:flagellar L-ring protein precursor FlgH
MTTLAPAFSIRLAATLLAVCGLSACTVLPAEPMKHSEGFTPVYPMSQEQAAQATGAIYNGRLSENFFGRGRSFQVGDVITVILDESTKAGRSQVGSLSRASTNDVLKGNNAVIAAAGNFLGGASTLGATVTNKGTGTADQSATLTGSVAVSVIEIMANGNLVLRGEKQVALTEGSEIIQVAGVVRAEDIAPNNTVASRRLANAQIAYRGTGDLAATSRAGWGTSALLKLWPF